MDCYYPGHVGGREWGKVEVKEGSQFDSREQHQSVWELNFIMEEHTGRAKCHGTRCQTARWEIDTSVSAHCDYFIEKLSGGMHQREMVTALVPNIGALSWMFWGPTFVCGHTYCSTNVFSSKQRVGCLTTRKSIHSSFSSNTQGHRDAGVYPSSHWVRNRNTSHHECSCFCADCLFFFFFC